MTSSADRVIRQMVAGQTKATASQLAQIADHVASAPFAAELLQVDQLLWGGFWQGDVIAPGYSLPAVELALLRAIRLDGRWPEGTRLDQFLADLHQAIRQPQAGVWALAVVGEPCLVFAAPAQDPKVATVVWYCATTGQLHAGYQTTADTLNFETASEQRTPQGLQRPQPHETGNVPEWLTLAVEQLEVNEAGSLAARLDAEILRQRSGKSQTGR